MPSSFARNVTTPSNRLPSSSTSSATNPAMSAPREIPQDIPILPSSAANTSHGTSPLASPPHQRGHSRSISHPFNHNPFSGLTKRRNQSISTKDFLDSDDDDEVTFTPVPLSSSPRKPLPRPPPGGGELITGRCMTCSTTVRWPNNLKTFRCTECLMVNDLEPYKESGDAGPGKDGKPAVSRKGKLRCYLTSWLIG